MDLEYLHQPAMKHDHSKSLANCKIENWFCLEDSIPTFRPLWILQVTEAYMDLVGQNGPSIRCVQYSSVSVLFLSDSGCFWKMDECNTRLIMTVAVEHHTVSRFHIRIVVDGKTWTQSEWKELRTNLSDTSL
ncbi:hypothetical protein SCLCIDRAFT_244306 [Scleroderma citrinum Foug A]|uniref:Uncharacterized protein n=1 Tax=Scleroderma citrinum Foug A TaxID=1036808 RepID=A0A0C2ZV21_9AGAM|nr:hypothetical protein SCLCIDRAFT_244306 [Scleroderma citrinum Foug A]